MKRKEKTEKALPFFFLFAAFFLFHLLLPHIRDDIVIEQGMDFTSVTPSYIRYLIRSKYEEWSSRIFINIMTLIMGKLPHSIWILIDCLMTVLAAWSISCLTEEVFYDTADRNRRKMLENQRIEQEEQRKNLFLIALFLLYPFSHMATAGWKATTVTYWWALACGLYAMLPISRWLKEERIKGWEYPLFLLAVLYGANQEQMSAVLTGIYSCVLFYAVYMGKRKRKSGSFWFLCILFLISLISFFSALFCPGNGVRAGDETATWFADYGRLSFIHKMEMGVSSAGYELFYNGNLCFLILSGLLFWMVISKYQEKEYGIISAIPFVISLITGPLFPVVTAVLPGLQKWKTSLTSYGTITVENYTESSSYLPFIGIFFSIGCVLITFYLIYEKSWKTGAMCAIFLIGFASRAVMGFSPTVWASSYRTYLFLYMSMLVLAVFSFREALKRKIPLEKLEKLIYPVAVFSFISQLFAL